ncbi:MFS transporter [Altericroceibacterium endophyticum]|uniref:MFS transporter n=1 Tax=Altericroceibacterium endophyticum TaxID=1808508 RepID=A0A6I4T9Z8_9SPHN|nr:MFS transporter [Altericroceibacterium endophyticum]MXO67122.1 MFS transporter [Altericroceibacterium endophyticum]
MNALAQLNTSYGNHRTKVLCGAFAAANAGATIGYLPLFAVFLPLKIEGLSETPSFNLYTLIAIVGTLTAMAANIFFGWLSDASVRAGHGRRGWISFGVAGLALSYLGFAYAQQVTLLFLSVMAIQIAANAILAPLLATMADEIPDNRKGITGGLMTLANPLAAAVAWLLLTLPAGNEILRFGALSAIVMLLLLPLLHIRARRLPASPDAMACRGPARRNLAVTWLARLCIQSAGNGLTLYLFFYFRTLQADLAASTTAGFLSQLLIAGYLLPLPFALALGRQSDLNGRRKPMLLCAAFIAAAGLITMALASASWAGAMGFLIYAVGAQIFMAIHAAFWMQSLPDADRRGRDLGILNLANTLPALIGALMAWFVARPDTFGPALALMAVIVAFGGVLMLLVDEHAPQADLPCPQG